jgi:O-antigen chain-terminating methyltransferase
VGDGEETVDLRQEVISLRGRLERVEERLSRSSGEGEHVHDHGLDSLYYAFEEKFRGPREEILERLQVYLPYLRETDGGKRGEPALDLGCGRGEWLELLSKEGWKVRGVDQNRPALEVCRKRGLDVTEEDLFRFLGKAGDGSTALVTAFHVVEHLPFEAVIRLLDETVRVLRPGGLAIFETPNPDNIMVGARNFYLDPTHRNPVPSAVLQFFCEARGLSRVEVLNLHPVPYKARVRGICSAARRMNQLFSGPQDYAVVGRRP